MCFSPTASFTVGTALLAGGIYGTVYALEREPKLTPLAAYPIAFGLQQIMEGGVWMSLLQGDGYPTARLFALGFLSFSHGFWLFWVPFSIYWAAPPGLRRQILLGMTILGALFGASLYGPLLINDWVQVAIGDRHIVYDVILLYSGLIPWSVGRLIYASFIVGPFLLSQRWSVRGLGALILCSMAATTMLYAAENFISVWCFFAAVISAYIILLLRQQSVLEPQ